MERKTAFIDLEYSRPGNDFEQCVTGNLPTKSIIKHIDLLKESIKRLQEVYDEIQDDELITMGSIDPKYIMIVGPLSTIENLKMKGLVIYEDELDNESEEDESEEEEEEEDDEEEVRIEIEED